MSRSTATSDLLAPARHCFLSPHFDDIALSCGGTAALLARAGRRPVAAVIFGGKPEPTTALTDFARFQHERWGLDAETAIAERQAEEATAAAILGLDVELLSFPDAIYRGDRYLDDEHLFAEPTEDEGELPGRIVSALGFRGEPTGATRIYAPLAVGGHVDHRHAFEAGVKLARSGWPVWYYEDQPYALEPEMVRERAAAVSSELELEQAAVIDVTKTWREKVEAVLAYRSQVPVIFRHVAPEADAASVEAALLAGARTVGCDQAAERFWRLADPSEAPARKPRKLPLGGY